MTIYKEHILGIQSLCLTSPAACIYTAEPLGTLTPSVGAFRVRLWVNQTEGNQ